MKQVIKPAAIKYSLLAIACMFIHTLLWAQDSSQTATSVTTTTNTQTMWYSAPWVWVVGGIILIILIVLLAGGNKANKRTDKVTITETRKTDANY